MRNDVLAFNDSTLRCILIELNAQVLQRTVVSHFELAGLWVVIHAKEMLRLQSSQLLCRQRLQIHFISRTVTGYVVQCSLLRCCGV